MTAKVAAAEETKEPTPGLKTIARMKSFAQRAKRSASGPGQLRRQMSQRIVAYREASERTKVLKAKERLAKSKAAIDHAGGLLADADDLYFPRSSCTGLLYCCTCSRPTRRSSLWRCSST